MAIDVYMVRHGQTYLNEFGKMQGWSDAPLTDQGWQDAKRAGEALSEIDFDFAFTSDLKRAIDTAQTILRNHPTKIQKATPNSAFRESFFGYFEGLHSGFTATTIGGPLGVKTWEQLIEQVGIEKSRDLTKAADPFKRAEDNRDFWERLAPGFETLRSLPDQSKVLLVSHGMTIRSIISKYGQPGQALIAPQNGAITKLVITPTDIKVAFYNQLTIPQGDEA